MPIVKPAKFKGEDVQVRELTVAELDDILANTGEMSMIDRLFDADLVTERMLSVTTGIPAEDLRSVSASDLRPLVEVVKEAHPDFLSAMAHFDQRRAAALAR